MKIGDSLASNVPAGRTTWLDKMLNNMVTAKLEKMMSNMVVAKLVKMLRLMMMCADGGRLKVEICKSRTCLNALKTITYL